LKGKNEEKNPAQIDVSLLDIDIDLGFVWQGQKGNL